MSWPCILRCRLQHTVHVSQSLPSAPHSAPLASPPVQQMLPDFPDWFPHPPAAYHPISPSTIYTSHSRIFLPVHECCFIVYLRSSHPVCCCLFLPLQFWPTAFFWPACCFGFWLLKMLPLFPNLYICLLCLLLGPPPICPIHMTIVKLHYIHLTKLRQGNRVCEKKVCDGFIYNRKIQHIFNEYSNKCTCLISRYKYSSTHYFSV